MGQIKRCFLNPPVERHVYGVSNDDSAGESFGSGAGAVAAELIGALANL